MRDKSIIISAGIGGICAVLYDVGRNEQNHIGMISHGLCQLGMSCKDYMGYITALVIICIAIGLCWIFDEKTKPKAFYVGLSVLATIGFLTTGKPVPPVTPSNRLQTPSPEETGQRPNHNSQMMTPPEVVLAAERAPQQTESKADIWFHLVETPSQLATLEIRGKGSGYFARSAFNSPDMTVSLPAGDNYVVTISASGYRVVQFDVAPRSGEYKRFDINLRPTSVPIGVQKLIGSFDQPRASVGFFSIECSLPFEHIREQHPIDTVCGRDGLTDKPENRIQDAVKNNFCALGPPVPLSFEDFRALQVVVSERGIPFGRRDQLPADRSVLRSLLSVANKKIGEGSLVRLSGYILNAHSNLTNGESVNCRMPGPAYNDIHVDLVQRPDETDACTSITAEISPHFRPSVWAPGNLQDVRRPVRISGQLFFDASHVPCQGGRAGLPRRASLWEIHPVYGIDVITPELSPRNGNAPVAIS
jgi:hypothetical protein